MVHAYIANKWLIDGTKWCKNNLLQGQRVKKYNKRKVKTRTTRKPTFWGCPLLPHVWYPQCPMITPTIHTGSQVKTRQSQSYKCQEFAKTKNFLMLLISVHAKHLLKLVDNRYKYEMQLVSIVEDILRTLFCPQTDRCADGWTDRQGEIGIPSPLLFQICWSRGIIKLICYTL